MNIAEKTRKSFEIRGGVLAMESPVGWRCSQRRGAYKHGIMTSTRNEKKNGRPAAGMRNPHHKDMQIFRNPPNFSR